MAQQLRWLLASLTLLSQALLSEARAKQPGMQAGGKSFFDVESPTELVWRALKLCLAFSPIIAIAACFCCSYESKDVEEDRRRQTDGASFTVGKKGTAKMAHAD
mmetsp:Transcript_35745/g.83707  ORF Transcript_35745/g.83707 Transcript_35745/m.83707 type:complete len:104 (+) Transcript_35745:68-379(+)